MPSYKTPGVYVEEIATLPPSVADVATAIPAFLGYTESGEKNRPIRIGSMVDYEYYFGGPKPTPFTVTVEASGELTAAKTPADGANGKPPADSLMYYSVKLYFDNGGGPCYVISVGDYKATPAAADFTAGLEALEKEDEPTLILLTDAVNLGDDYYGLCQASLAQCAKLGDRFAILDVLDADKDASKFRNGIGINNLKYGAAYYPYLQTALPYAYLDAQVTVKRPPAFQIDNGLRITAGAAAETPKLQILAGIGGTDFEVTEGTLTIKNVGDNATAAQVVAAWNAWKSRPENRPQGFDIIQVGDGSAKVAPAASQGLDQPPAPR